jgi:hypothetical protein
MVDLSYNPMLDLPPGIPPPDVVANLYLLCQSYAARQGENFNLASRFIAETEGSKRCVWRLAPRPDEWVSSQSLL